MSPQLDPLAEEMATAAPGPGRFEWGTLSFPKSYWSGRAAPTIDVELDEQDGSVIVRWTDKADDGWGTCDRNASFTAAEFDQIIATRAELRDRESRRSGAQRERAS
jgi:hypothetical protein